MLYTTQSRLHFMAALGTLSSAVAYAAGWAGALASFLAYSGSAGFSVGQDLCAGATRPKAAAHSVTIRCVAVSCDRRYVRDMSAVNDTLSWQDRAAVSLMLDECETWAVVGLSGDRSRTAYRIAELLQERGKRIVPIHPDAPTVLGQQGYATLADVPFAIDVVDVFRRSEAAGQFADEAVAVGAKGVWFQLGVIDESAFDRTRKAGVAMVMDTCPAIEWRKRG